MSSFLTSIAERALRVRHFNVDFSILRCNYMSRKTLEHIMKKLEWKSELLDQLKDTATAIPSPFSGQTRRRATQRVLRGVMFLLREGIQFVGITEKRGFHMLDNRRDVLSKAGPHNGIELRRSLGTERRSNYGFEPAVYLFTAEWNNLYTALWQAVGKFFRKHPQYGAK